VPDVVFPALTAVSKPPVEKVNEYPSNCAVLSSVRCVYELIFQVPDTIVLPGFTLGGGVLPVLSELLLVQDEKMNRHRKAMLHSGAFIYFIYLN
jgi:hypothetical protein